MHDQFNQSEDVVTVVVTVAWYPHQPVQLAATATKENRNPGASGLPSWGGLAKRPRQ